MKIPMPLNPNIAVITQTLPNGTMFHEQIEYPVYPSCLIQIADSSYDSALFDVRHNINVPCVFVEDGLLVVPESYVELIEYLKLTYNAEVVAVGQMQHAEFASLAIAANLEGNLIALGHAVFGLTAETATDMLEKALKAPEDCKQSWDKLLLTSLANEARLAWVQ